MIYINRFFFNVFSKLRKVYLNSNIYDKKISKLNKNEFIYKPSPYLLSSLIKYQKNKIKIEEISVNTIWDHKNFNEKEFRPMISRFKDKNELKEFIAKHLFERKPCYDMSTYKIDCSENKTVDDVCEEIINTFN